jgi:hypothetical protein
VTRNSVYSCSSCNTTHTLVLNEPSLLACKNCYEIIASSDNIEKPLKAPVPSDWSFVQIGSTAEFKKIALRVIGRIRLQLRNEYKNFWCVEAGQGKCMWMMESFGSFAVLDPTWETYDGEVNKLRSGIPIDFRSGKRLTGEYVEKIEGLTYQGELGPWTEFLPGAFMVQASNADGVIAIYFIHSKEEIKFLAGEKISPENLKLANILMWNEWK